MERVFISGRMRDVPFCDAWMQFDRAECYFRNNGFIVWNPIKHLDSGSSWLRNMYMCLKNLSKSDIVVFLIGWEDSSGCIIEHAFAKMLGKDIVYQNKFKIV
jgi:hypothetical protein